MRAIAIDIAMVQLDSELWLNIMECCPGSVAALTSTCKELRWLRGQVQRFTARIANIGKVRSLAVSMRSLSGVLEFDLAQNGLTAESLGPLLAGITYMPRNESLDFSGNPGIGCNGMAVLSDALQFCRLKHLNVSHCDLSSEGMCHLAGALCTYDLSKLGSLILSGNDLREEASDFHNLVLWSVLL